MINVYGCSDFSSFLRVTDYAKRIWKPLRNVVPEEVNVVRLDDIFSEVAERTGCRSYYLKLDTQGYDVNVFRGGMNSLDRICAIQTELSLINVYNNTPPPYDVLKEFNRHNYLISGMYPINRDESLAVIECDCVLVKSPSLDVS